MLPLYTQSMVVMTISLLQPLVVPDQAFGSAGLQFNPQYLPTSIPRQLSYQLSTCIAVIIRQCFVTLWKRYILRKELLEDMVFSGN